MNTPIYLGNWPRGEGHIESLLARVQDCFPAKSPPKEISIVLYGVGDDYGRERVAAAFCKPWFEMTIDDIHKSGPDLLFHMSSEGLFYYLPGIISCLLREREFGWFEEALLPGAIGYEDVLDYFSDGTLQGDRGDTANKYFTRVEFLRSNLSHAQRDCVAQYVEVAESSGVKNPDSEFLVLLRKFADFWGRGSVALPLADSEAQLS